jgi:hypothetical protein
LELFGIFKNNEKIQGEGYDVEKKNFNNILEHKAMKGQINFFVRFNMLPSNFAETSWMYNRTIHNQS